MTRYAWPATSRIAHYWNMTYKPTKKKFQQHEKHLQRSTTFHTIKKQDFWNISCGPYSCTAVKPRHSQQRPGKTEAAEMWFYRRILRIPWTAHRTNVSVLQRMRQESKLPCIKQRQLKFLGPVIRKGELEDLALSGSIPGKRARGAQRFTLSITLRFM